MPARTMMASRATRKKGSSKALNIAASPYFPAGAGPAGGAVPAMAAISAFMWLT